MNITVGFFALLLATTIWSINDILIRIVGAQLSSYQQVVIRCTAGLLFTLILALFIKKPFHIGKTKKLYIFFYGITFPLTLLSFTIGINFTKIAAAIFAFYAGAFIFSFLLGILFFKEKVTPIKIFSLCLVIAGLFFITYPFSFKQINTGFLISLFAGSLASVNGSFSKHFGNKGNTIVIMLVPMIGAILLGSILTIYTHSSFIPFASLPVLFLCILSGIFLVITVPLTAWGFHHFDLHLGMIVASAELFISPVFAFLLFKEGLSMLQIIGAIFIAFAIVLPHLKLKLLSFHP